MSQPICFCLDCRTTLHSDDVCDEGNDHRVVSLHERGAHEQLVATTWGTANVRDAEQRLALRSERAVTVLTALVLVSSLVGVWLVTGTITWLHLLASIVASLVALQGGVHVVRRVGTQFPVGADRILDAPKLNCYGSVVGEASLCSPATGSMCIAYAVELRLEGNGNKRVMYRDAVTCGFDVKLDDGSLARIPKGRIRIAGKLREAMDLDNLELEAYLREIDSRRTPDSPYDPFRYNVVYEALILPGDRIELISAFEPRVNTNAESTLYRKSMPSLLWPSTVPRIRQLTSTI